MARSNPDRKLGIVVFDHEVEIIGDAVEKASKITDHNMLNDFNRLLENGWQNPEQKSGAIQKQDVKF